jgi:uncharacterized damage-inducible protein DinB
MNVEDFQLLYSYNAWANERTLDACISLSPEQFTRDLKSSFNSVRDTLVHIVSAEWIWLERWHGRAPTAFPNPLDYPDLESVQRRFGEIDRNLVDYAASLTGDDLQRVVSFKRATGEAFAVPLWQLLQHVANHSTYHRGQVATMLRQLGSKSASTDLSIFYRDRSTAPAA